MKGRGGRRRKKTIGAREREGGEKEKQRMKRK